MIYFLLLMTTLTTWAAPTKFDLNAGVQGRTLPSLGAEVYAESGYNFVFWGKVFDGVIGASLAAGLGKAGKIRADHEDISFVEHKVIIAE